MFIYDVQDVDIICVYLDCIHLWWVPVCEIPKLTRRVLSLIVECIILFMYWLFNVLVFKN